MDHLTEIIALAGVVTAFISGLLVQRSKEKERMDKYRNEKHHASLEVAEAWKEFLDPLRSRISSLEDEVSQLRDGNILLREENEKFRYGIEILVTQLVEEAGLEPKWRP